MAGDGPRRDWVPIVGWIAVVWLVVALVFGAVLWDEHHEVTGHPGFSCPIRGVDSGYGQPRWQWSPPGRYCVLPVGSNLGAEVPRVWNRPGEWRSILFVALMVSGVGLVGATAWGLRRDARKDRAVDPPVPDAPVDV